MPLRWVEAEDGVVGGVVARAAVPVVHAGVGAELHHAEGHCGTRESVAVAAGAYERVDVIGRVGNVVCLRLLLCASHEGK